MIQGDLRGHRDYHPAPPTRAAPRRWCTRPLRTARHRTHSGKDRSGIPRIRYREGSLWSGVGRHTASTAQWACPGTHAGSWLSRTEPALVAAQK